MNNSVWENAKKYLLPFDGGASQIHVLSLKKTDIGRILRIISENASNSKVTLISNNPLNSSININEVINNDELSKSLFNGQSTIFATIFDKADITFDLWSKKTQKTFDLEVWFWADQFFPSDDAINYKRFCKILSILKSINNNGGCKCILTPCEAGDPLDDLKNGYAIEIELNNV